MCEWDANGREEETICLSATRAPNRHSAVLSARKRNCHLFGSKWVINFFIGRINIMRMDFGLWIEQHVLTPNSVAVVPCSRSPSSRPCFLFRLRFFFHAHFWIKCSCQMNISFQFIAPTISLRPSVEYLMHIAFKRFPRELLICYCSPVALFFATRVYTPAVNICVAADGNGWLCNIEYTMNN